MTLCEATALISTVRQSKLTTAGVSAGDPVTLLAVSALLMAAALLASYLPARRAADLEPTVSLRQD